jgi:hypothetical protein
MRWTSFGLGAGSFFFFWIPFLAFPASLAAVITGMIAMAKGRQQRLAGASDGPAIIGVLMGFIALIASALIGLIVLISVVMEAAFEGIEVQPQPIEYDYTTM